REERVKGSSASHHCYFSTTISEKSAILVNSFRIAPRSACRFLFRSPSGQFTRTSTKNRSSDGEIEAIVSRASEYRRAGTSSSSSASATGGESPGRSAG